MNKNCDFRNLCTPGSRVSLFTVDHHPWLVKMGARQKLLRIAKFLKVSSTPAHLEDKLNAWPE